MSLMQAMVALLISGTAILASSNLLMAARLHQKQAYLREIALMELSSKVACLKAHLSREKPDKISRERFNQAQGRCENLYMGSLSIDRPMNAAVRRAPLQDQSLCFEITDKKNDAGLLVYRIKVLWKGYGKKSNIVPPLSVNISF